MTNPEAVEALVEAVAYIERYKLMRQEKRQAARDALAALSSAPVAASKVKTETPASPADLLAHLRRIPMTEWVWQDAEMIFATLEAAALSHASPVEEGGFRSAVFGAVHQLLPAAHDARSTRFRASVQVEVARILEEARAAMLAASTPKDTGERG